MPIESAPAGRDSSAPESEAPGPLHGWAMIWTLLGIFAGGMALNLTPCVYPLIPITVSYFGGQAAKGRGRDKIVLHALSYTAGLAFTNSVLGVVAALTGGLVGAKLQSPLVLMGVAAVLLVFAASLLGFWELRLPSTLTHAASKSYAGYFGTLFMGLTLGVVAAPCIGPFVLGLLTWVASMASPWLGFLIFFTLSLGLGVPIFFLAVFSGRIEKLPPSGPWMLWVRKLMAWVLIGMAVYFVRPVLPDLWATLLFAAAAVAAGAHLGWMQGDPIEPRVLRRVKLGVGLGCMVLAAFLVTSWAMRGPGVAWTPYSEQTLKEAQNLKKPVILDFYAAWCAPCRELEEVTFHDASVVREAESDFVMVKVDVTKGGNHRQERLLQEYAVKGVPTILFLDVKGRERRDLRLVDYIPPDQFLDRMVELKKTKP